MGKFIRVLPIAALLFAGGCILIGYGTIETPAGYIGGQTALRNWLGFSERMPIDSDSVAARLLEDYPLGSDFATLQSDALAAGFEQWPDSQSFDDPLMWAHSNCFTPSGNFEITVRTDDQGRITDIEVVDVEACL